MQPIVIRIQDIPEELKVVVSVLEFGKIAHKADFDYQFPSERCSGDALDRASEEARFWQDDYMSRHMETTFEQDF